MSYPTTHNLWRVKQALAAGACITIMGDSYAQQDGDRYTAQLLAGLTIGKPITALLVNPNGSALSNGRADVAQWNTPGSTSTTQGAVNVNDYLLGVGDRVGLPVNSIFERQMSTGEVMTSSVALRIQTTVRSWIDSARYWAYGANAGFRARHLYYSPTTLADADDSDYTIHDRAAGNPALATVNLRTNARGFRHLSEDPTANRGAPVAGRINAFVEETDHAIQVSDGVYLVEIRRSNGSTFNDKYFHHAGALIQKTSNGEWEPGTYFRTLNDSSWGLSGYSANTASDGTTPKQYLNDEFVHWLDVSTMDPDQPHVYFVIVDNETTPTDTADRQSRHLIQQIEAAHAAIGLSDPIVCFVHAQRKDADTTTQVAFGQGMYDAVASSKHAFVSLYQATGGTLFDGSASADAWLSSNGYGSITHGTQAGSLLGKDMISDGLHPTDDLSAAFFAKVIDGQIQRAAGGPLLETGPRKIAMFDDDDLAWCVVVKQSGNVYDKTKSTFVAKPFQTSDAGLDLSEGAENLHTFALPESITGTVACHLYRKPAAALTSDDLASDGVSTISLSL